MNRRRPDDFSGDLFTMPSKPVLMPGSMDYRTPVSDLLSNMLSDAARMGVDRHEICARASRLAGFDVTKSMLDGYTSPARDKFNVPLWLGPAIEAACESTALCNWFAGVRGSRVLAGAEILDAEIGRRIREQEKTNRELRELRELRRRFPNG